MNLYRETFMKMFILLKEYLKIALYNSAQSIKPIVELAFLHF